MADNVEINAATVPGGAKIATLSVIEGPDTVMHEKVIVEHLVAGEPVMTAEANPLPVKDAAVVAKQDEQAALLLALNSLIETNNYLIGLLAPLAAAMNSGAPALRVFPIAAAATAVTGTVTATVASTVVSSQTNFGLGIPASEMANDMNNLLVTMANINNTKI